MRRQEVAARRQHADRQQHRDQERLVDDLVDALMIVGARRARDQHAHAREQRADEDDDDQEDLPADADRRVRGEADEVADHRMIDDALQPADRVLQHRRPGDLPHRPPDRAFDDRPIELRPARDAAGAPPAGAESSGSAWASAGGGAVASKTENHSSP